MKRAILYLLFELAFSAFGQNNQYFDRLDRTELEPYVARAATQAELDVMNLDKQGYAGLLLEGINSVRTLKQRAVFEQDSAFNQMCNVGVKHFPQAYFRNKTKRHKIIRYAEFGLRHLKGKHRMFRVFSFNYNLTTLSNLTPFYYARNDETSPLKLFWGRRPRVTDPNHEDYEEPKPVRPISEKEFVRGLCRAFEHSKGGKDLLSRNFTHIGIAIRVDEFTLNRKKIPRAFVMVIIGGKQIQKARDVEPAKLEDEDVNNPYILLK